MLPHLNDIITIRHNRTKFLQFLKKNHNEENRNILFNFSFYPNGKSNGTKFHGIEEDFCWTFLDSLGIKHRKYRYQQFLVEVDCVKNWGVCACYQILCKRLLYWMCILERVGIIFHVGNVTVFGTCDTEAAWYSLFVTPTFRSLFNQAANFSAYYLTFYTGVWFHI